MIRLLKRSALGMLTRAGYKLLTWAEYEQLLAATAASPVVEPPPALALLPQAGDTISELLAKDPIESLGPAIPDFLNASGTASELPPLRRLALYAAAQYLCDSGVNGTVMDCGSGATAALATLAMAFRHIGDVSRQLILFDTTADPTHRAEFEFVLWGRDRDLIVGRQPESWRPVPDEPPPSELAATGYPTGNVSVRRYPREDITALGPLAFLGVTSLTYPANQEAIATYFPLLSSGGVLAVEGPFGSGAGAVDRYLRDAGIALLLLPIAADFRVAIKL